MSFGLRAGAISDTTVAPPRSRQISSGVGAFTLTTTSLDHTSSASVDPDAGGLVRTVVLVGPVPAPRSTTTS